MSGRKPAEADLVLEEFVQKRKLEVIDVDVQGVGLVHGEAAVYHQSLEPAADHEVVYLDILAGDNYFRFVELPDVVVDAHVGVQRVGLDH